MRAHRPSDTTRLAIMAATAPIIVPSPIDPAGVDMIGGKAVPQALVFTGRASETRATVRLAMAARPTTASRVTAIRGPANRGPVIRNTAAVDTAIRVTTVGQPTAALPTAIPDGNAPARRSGGMWGREAGDVLWLAPRLKLNAD